MPDHKFPGVYIEETPKLPPAIAGAVQSVPLFIACTNITPKENPVRLDSLTDFEIKFKVKSRPVMTFPGRKLTSQKELQIKRFTETGYSLHDYLSLYFANGGGACWLFSCGADDGKITRQKQLYLDALAALSEEHEFDLLVLADAVKLSAADYAEVMNAAISRAYELGAFFIGDVCPQIATEIVSQNIAAFRDSIYAATVKNAAFYYPWLVFNSASGTEVKVPPSAAVAGVYVQTDHTRGIWKAPANVALRGVINPTQTIAAEETDSMNVDASRGFSVNAIRTFTGKGTLVWGARTLAGNDNEWRYVPIRRLFLWVERSIQNASQWVVFEPNDANTWVKLQGGIENFLVSLWRQGALMGTKPEQAFFVNIGLNKTMTSLDILEGRLIVEIGMAPVRPAEFIILRIRFDVSQS